MNSKLISRIPLPMCIIDGNGKVRDASERIGDVFLYDEIHGADVFALTGIKHEQLQQAAAAGDELKIRRSDKTFRVIPSQVQDGSGELLIYFVDITEEEEIRKKYRDEQSCFAILSVDNFDELMNSTEEDNQAELTSVIDKVIRTWASTMEASLTKYKDHEFLVVMTMEEYRQQARSKFDILEKIKKVETEADFPVTLSIGVGMGADSMESNDEYASDALDIAFGRGGDQAVVKDGNSLMYFGGRTETVEKGNKGKSRIIGHALVRLIQTASRVFIMGHRSPDLDAFGSALGIYRMAQPLNKETYIVLNRHNEAVETVYELVKASEEYKIINNHKVDTLFKDRSLVIVVDTHRPSITEYPELVERADRVAVIDHHRKGEETIAKPTLAYTEPYASSTAELVTEILQYTIEKKQLTKLESEALMAGIWVDTNRFSVKTGVRTFEAAAWLRRAGADIMEVKRFFQSDITVFCKRAKAVADAEYDNEVGVAFSICEGQDDNMQIINSMVADELLTVKGMRASFVAGCDSCGKVCVSARSVGDLNVQVLMEKMGGGGHRNTAGTQLEGTPEDAIRQIKELLEMRKDESNTEEGR